MESQFIKSKKALLTVLLSITLSCSSCSTIKEKQTVSENPVEFKSKVKDNLSKQYLKYFQEFEANYNYEEHFITEEEVNQTIEKYTINRTCQKNYNYSSYNIKKLIDKIEKNSNQYLQNNSQCIKAFVDFSSNFYLVYQQLCFERALTKALSQIIKQSTNDINEDLHRMQTLSIVYINDQDKLYTGIYDERENSIKINIAIIEKSATDNQTSFYEELYYTLLHEIDHLRQTKCDCRIDNQNDRRRISYTTEYDTLLIETSAESSIYNQNMNQTTIDSDDYSYIEEREYESLLFLLALFNKDTTINDYYNAMFDTNLGQLFKFFNCKTDADKYDLFKMLYIIDGINIRSNLFYDIYTKEKLSTITVSYAINDLGQGYRSEIFAKCLSGFVNYNNTYNDLSLEDNLVLYNIIKAKIVGESCSYTLKYATTANQINNKNIFISEITNLDIMYMNYLSNYYNVSVEDIRYIEETKIPLYGNVIKHIVKKDKVSNETEQYNKALDLLKKFPLLEPIIFASTINFSTFNKLTTENQNAEINTKKLIKQQ